MSALEASAEAVFLRRVGDLVEEKLKQAPDPGLLEALAVRGREAGFSSEQQLAAYIFIGVAAEAREADPPWMAEILALPLSADERAQRLFEAAPHHLAAVAPR